MVVQRRDFHAFEQVNDACQLIRNECRGQVSWPSSGDSITNVAGDVVTGASFFAACHG